jgi:ribosomal protein S18 acetylase RimI-like enzyme
MTSNVSPQLFVRVATRIDAPCISRHIQASKNEASRYRGQVPVADHPHVILELVAGVDGEVLASLQASSSEPASAHIHHVFVDESAREVGLGDSIMRECLKQLGEMGYSTVSAMAQPGDRQLKNLFERHGLVAQTIIVGRNL